MGCKLRVVSCGLRVVSCRVRVAGYGLRVPGFRLCGLNAEFTLYVPDIYTVAFGFK